MEIFENALKEAYKANPEDVKRFKTISPETIMSVMDCTILSGPHDDKTGPCYCVDDHDHHIQILYMHDILEAIGNFSFKDGTFVLVNSDDFNDYVDRLTFENNQYFKYGNYILIANNDVKTATYLIEECVDIVDCGYGRDQPECYILALTTSVEKRLNYGGYGYDVYDITFPEISFDIKKNGFAIPDYIRNVNNYALEKVPTNAVFEKLKERK